MALSFANVQGCSEIWGFIERVRQYLFDHSDSSSDGLDSPSRFDNAESDREQRRQRSPSTSSPPGSLFRGNNVAGLGVTASTQSSGLLPYPTLSNLNEVETALKWSSRTPLGRERLASWVVKTDYVKRLIATMTDAEDLESLDSLHTLCVVMQGIRA